jgi:hypothetical protein
VRSTAQINQRTAPVNRRLGAIRHALANKVLLILAVLEHFEEFVLGHLEAHKGLLFLDDRVGNGLERLLILFDNSMTKTQLAKALTYPTCSLEKELGSYPSMLAMS